MKKLLFLLFLPALVFAQNQQRITSAVQNNSGYAKLIPFAKVTVCVDNSLLQCNTPVIIYSDQALTQQIQYPFYADQNGNYSWFTHAGTYVEQVCGPLNQCYANHITVISGGGISSAITQITGPSSTVTGSVTFNGSGVSQSGNTFTFTGGSSGNCGPLPGDATSTNCGNNNLTGNTATDVQTFGYTNANSVANASVKALSGAGNLTANGLGVTNPIVGTGYDNFLIGTIPAADVTLQDAYAFGNENVNLSGTSTHFSADVLLTEGFDNLCSSNPGNATFTDDYFYGENVFCYTANGGTVSVSNVLAMGDTVGNMTIGTGTLNLSQMVALGNQTGEFGLTNGTDTTHDVVAIGNVTGIGDNDTYLNAIGSSVLGFVENSHNINAVGYLVGGGLTNSHDLFLNGDTILNGATHNALVNGIATGYNVLPQTAAANLTDFICQGDNACPNVTGGSDFVATGKTAGGSDATGSNWAAYGDGAGANGAAYSNWAAFGPNAIVTAANQIVLGNSSMTSAYFFGTGTGCLSASAGGLITGSGSACVSGGSATVFCTPNAQTGTAYTLVLADGTASGSACIGTVTMNNAAANNVTVPPNSSVAFPVPDEIDLTQLGAGQSCFVAGAGVTLITPTSLCTRAQYSTIGIRQISVNTYILYGDTQ